MPRDIACWFSEVVLDPTPLAPSYLGVDSLLFSSFPQFFVPYDLWPVDVHDGHQASVDKGLQGLVHTYHPHLQGGINLCCLFYCQHLNLFTVAKLPLVINSVD